MQPRCENGFFSLRPGEKSSSAESQRRKNLPSRKEHISSQEERRKKAIWADEMRCPSRFIPTCFISRPDFGPSQPPLPSSSLPPTAISCTLIYIWSKRHVLHPGETGCGIICPKKEKQPASIRDKKETNDISHMVLSGDNDCLKSEILFWILLPFSLSLSSRGTNESVAFFLLHLSQQPKMEICSVSFSSSSGVVHVCSKFHFRAFPLLLPSKS